MNSKVYTQLALTMIFVHFQNGEKIRGSKISASAAGFSNALINDVVGFQQKYKSKSL